MASEVIFVSESVVALWETEVRSPYQRETGGMLLGYETVSEQLVLTMASSPGPNARRRFLSMEPDQEWDTNLVTHIFEQSSKLITYKGEWHSHPFGVVRPSLTDMRTIGRVAEYADARVREPVTAIVSRPIIGGLQWAIYRMYESGQLKRSRVRVVSNDVAVPLAN
jgi:integrative and conjugative element protein (TIGR02256 family)